MLVLIIFSRIFQFVALAYIFVLGLKSVVKDEITRNDFIFLWVCALLLQLQIFMRSM